MDGLADPLFSPPMLLAKPKLRPLECSPPFDSNQQLRQQQQRCLFHRWRNIGRQTRHGLRMLKSCFASTVKVLIRATHHWAAPHSQHSEHTLTMIRKWSLGGSWCRSHDLRLWKGQFSRSADTQKHSSQGDSPLRANSGLRVPCSTSVSCSVMLPVPVLQQNRHGNHSSTGS